MEFCLVLVYYWIKDVCIKIRFMLRVRFGWMDVIIDVYVRGMILCSVLYCNGFINNFNKN